MSITCGLRSSRLYQGGKCRGDQAPRTPFMPSAEQGFTGLEERTGEVATARTARGLLGVETPRVSRVYTGGCVTVTSGPGPFWRKEFRPQLSIWAPPPHPDVAVGNLVKYSGSRLKILRGAWQQQTQILWEKFV